LICLLLLAKLYLAVTLAAVDRSALTRLERHFGFLAALGAYGGEHLASGTITVVIISKALGSPRFTTCRAPFGLVGVTFLLEELLFLSAKGEGFTTVGALEALVLESHWMTSSLRYLARALVIQRLQD
jgi:hypothetical protein